MEILSPTEWRHKFIDLTKEEINEPNIIISLKNSIKGNGYSLSENESRMKMEEYETKLNAFRDARMVCMRPLFVGKPEFEKICRKWDNNFVESGFTSYRASYSEYVKTYAVKDLKYIINLCGYQITTLSLIGKPFPSLMQLINNDCPNLKNLSVRFDNFESKDFESNDFKNVFSKMSHLETLSIYGSCINSNLPMTLVKSLEQISGNLKSLNLQVTFKENNSHYLPDSFVSVFPQLTALEFLRVWGFKLNQPLIQSISQIKNLIDISFEQSMGENTMLYERYNLYSIGNLKNLERLYIMWSNCCVVGDEFLINLSNNAKKMKEITIIGTNLTDNGIIAVNNLKELKHFNINLIPSKQNEYITDESIGSLFNKDLQHLNISNCTKITNDSLIKLVKNLPNLRYLNVQNTKVNHDVVNKIDRITEYREISLLILVSFSNFNNMFESVDLKNIHFSKCPGPKNPLYC